MFVSPRIAAAAAWALMWSLGASAADFTPVGHWRTFSDKTGAQTGLIEITQSGDEISGRIVKLIQEPGDPADPICDKCDGPEKDQHMIGMTILKGFRRDGDEWNGGTILDPRTGNHYNSELRLDEDGNKLLVRGYMGLPILGRTVTWVRGE